MDIKSELEHNKLNCNICLSYLRILIIFPNRSTIDIEQHLINHENNNYLKNKEIKIY